MMTSPLFQTGKAATVERQLRERITSGYWADGSLLPNERELSTEMGVSRMTLRKAMKGLEEVGLLERLQGKGTFARFPDQEQSGQTNVTVLLNGISSFGDDPFHSHISRGIQEGLQNTNVFVSHHLSETLKPLSQVLLENPDMIKKSQGILTFSYQLDEASLALCHEAKVPVVGLGEPDPQVSCHYVDIDNFRGGEMALQHLFQHGWTRPLIIESEESPPSRARMGGIKTAFQSQGIPWDPKRILITPGSIHSLTPEATCLAIRDHLKGGLEIDSFYVYLEANTLGVYQWLREEDLKPKSDIGVVHYNDYPWLSQVLRPAPSAVRQPFVTMGREAMELLLRVMADPEMPWAKRLVQPLLIPRDSC